MPGRPTRKPRKRPRQARSTATYALILEAAARILETRGLEAANTNAIAERAGISVGSLYQYFPDKAAIFAELVRNSERETADGLEALMEATAGRPAADRLARFVTAGVAQQLRRPQLARILDILELEMPEDPALKASEQRILAVIGQLLHEHRAAMSAPACPVVARDVLSIVKGMVDGAGMACETDPGDLERRVSRAVFGYLGLS